MFLNKKYYSKENPVVFEHELEAAATEDITNVILDQTKFNKAFLERTIKKCEVVNDVFTGRPKEFSFTLDNGERITVVAMNPDGGPEGAYFEVR